MIDWRGLVAKVWRDVPNQTIIDAIDPWVLACAVGAKNGTIGFKGYSYWFHRSWPSWGPDVCAKTGAWPYQVRRALRWFVAWRPMTPYDVVLRQVERERGLPESNVIAPGGTMDIVIEIDASGPRSRAIIGGKPTPWQPMRERPPESWPPTSN